MSKKGTKGLAGKVALYGILVSLAFIFSYIEALIPLPFGPFPGMKLGLANIVVVVVLYTVGAGGAFAVSMVRVILVGFTFGNLNSMLYSLAGGLLSWLVMVLLKKTDRFGVAGVSVAGGVCHNIGQMLVATVMLGRALGYYYPFLSLIGAITGVVIGIVAGLIVDRLKKYVKNRR